MAVATVSGAHPVFDPLDDEGLRGRLIAFLQAEGLSAVSIGPMRRYTVGFSWVTYGLICTWCPAGSSTAITRDLILRVGPPQGIFGPYQAGPQFHALKALGDSGVPVPGVWWFSDDTTVLGAPFFVCDRVEGEAPLPWTADGGPAFDEATRGVLGAQFLDALVALHRFDWRGTGAEALSGARDPAATATAEIDFWEERIHRWSTRRQPLLEWAVHWFRAHAPVADRVSIVHGDYRIGNFLEGGGRITAILDWELVHLGDPMEDLGWICLQAWRGRSPFLCHLLTREELAEGYERATGRPVDARAVRYWEAFGTFKLAVMHLAAAYSFGTLGSNDLRMAGMGAQFPRVLAQMETALERVA